MNYALSYQSQLSGGGRCVAVNDDDGFVAATSNGNVTMFARSSATEWRSTKLFSGERIHGINPGLITCIRRHKKGAFVSCGSDKRALIWNISGERLAQLVGGHSQGLTSIDQVSNGDIVTGSSDGTAVLWHKFERVQSLEEHEFAVAVLSLDADRICTGSGTRDSGNLRLWHDGRKIGENLTAHQRIVKKVIRHPLGLVSCANDGYVKIWTSDPPFTCLMECLAHPAGDRDSFVYSIDVLPSSNLVSVGEDKFARIIATDGNILQSLRHPDSVRDVAVMPNGDIVTVCSDGFVRVWTQDANRMAEESVRAEYEQFLELAESSQVQALDPSQLKPLSTLNEPGSKPGEVIIVDVPSKGPTVYQWNADTTQWDEIGAALGKNENKNMLEGVQYDHIVDVVVTEGAPPLKLGFNASDEPETVARAFCTRHGFGEDAFPQIVEYLQPLANPVARLQKLERERQHLKLIPTWKQEGFIVDSKIVTKPLESAIQASNNGFEAGLALNAVQMTEFSSIITVLEKFHTSKLPFTPQMSAVVEHLVTQWPLDKLLPVLDMVRMLAAVHPDAAVLCEKPCIVEKLLAVANEGSPVHLALVLKIYGNWMAKHLGPAESSNSILILLCKLVDNLKSGASCSSAAAVSAFITLVHNILCFIGKYYRQSDDSLSPLLRSLCNSLESFFSGDRNEKPTYLALLAFGTIAFSWQAGKTIARASPTLRHLASLKKSSNPSIRQAAQEAEKCCS